MPLAKIKCCQGGEQSFDFCLARSVYGGPGACQFPPALLAQMKDQENHRKDAGRSATGILACPRQHILMRENEYAESPNTYYPLFQGEAVHTIMEKYGSFDGWITEKRYGRVIEVDGVEYEITGKPDAFSPAMQLIRDYKTTSALIDCTKKKFPQQFCLERAIEKHEDQVNIYSWILYDGFDVVTGERVAYDIEHGELYYLNKGVKNLRVPIWTTGVQDTFVRERLVPLVAYDRSGVLPPVLPDTITVKINKKTGVKTVEQKRNWSCDWCPVRELCDRLAAEGK